MTVHAYVVPLGSFSELVARRSVTLTGWLSQRTDVRSSAPWQAHCAGVLLARWALHRHGVPWSALERWQQTDRGRPYVPGIGVDFNISHSDRFVTCAVAEEGVGVDIETIRPLGPRFAQRMLSPAELTEFASDTGLPSDRDVTRLWTLKEAYLKFLGTGIETSPRMTELSKRNGVWQVRHRREPDPRVSLNDFHVGQDAVLSICASEGRPMAVEHVAAASVVESLLDRTGLARNQLS